MGNYITASSPLLTLATTKGDFSNKAGAAKEQYKENLVYSFKSLGAVVGVGAATALTLKSKTLNDGFTKAINTGAGKTSKLMEKALPKNISKYIRYGIQKFKTVPGYAKIIGAGLIVAGAIDKHLRASMYYKKGKVDQKYETLANMKANTRTALEKQINTD